MMKINLKRVLNGVLCMAFFILSAAGCARTVTSLQLAGNDLVLTFNLSAPIQNGNRYYVVFSSSTTADNVVLPALGDYFVAPGEGDYSDGLLKQFDSEVPSINTYYFHFFNTWSDVILFNVTNESSSAGANPYLVQSGSGVFPDDIGDDANTTFNPIFSVIEAPYFPTTTQIRLALPISQLSPSFALGDHIYFKILAVNSSTAATNPRILADLVEGTLSVENTSGALSSGSDDGADRFSGSDASLEITSWSVQIQ